MKYKCEKHKSNEGFTNDSNKWVCWECYKRRQMEISRRNYDILTEDLSVLRSVIDSYEVNLSSDDYDDEVFVEFIKMTPHNQESFYTVSTLIFRSFFNEDGDLVDTEEEEWKCYKFGNYEFAQLYFNKEVERWVE